MATLSSLQDRLQGIGSRLQAENDSKSRDILTNNLTLDFSRERPGSERRPRNTSLAEAVSTGRPNTISARPREPRPRIQPLLFIPQPRPQDSPELKAHMKQIALKNGILTIDGKKHTSSNEDLKYIAELGSGTSGNVVKMLHKPSNKVIAVKQMNRSGNLEETKRVFFDLEVVLKSHDCPYIVQCLGCFVSDNHVWICMELMATCLDKLLKRNRKALPEKILGKISVATVKALHYLKENHGVIHRDVKPSNILLDEMGNIKLCDFGISGRLVDSKANTRSAGCAAYMAPERIDPPDPRNPDYDIRADVWSLGITLVELATGYFPYRDCKTDFEVLTKVLDNDPPSLPESLEFSPQFRQFVKDCLVKDYKLRPKYKKLLEYPFIKQYEKETVNVAAWFEEVMVSSTPTEATSAERVRSSPHRSRLSSRFINNSGSNPRVTSHSASLPPPTPSHKVEAKGDRSVEEITASVNSSLSIRGRSSTPEGSSYSSKQFTPDLQVSKGSSPSINHRTASSPNNPSKVAYQPFNPLKYTSLNSSSPAPKSSPYPPYSEPSQKPYTENSQSFKQNRVNKFNYENSPYNPPLARQSSANSSPFHSSAMNNCDDSARVPSSPYSTTKVNQSIYYNPYTPSKSSYSSKSYKGSKTSPISAYETNNSFTNPVMKWGEGEQYSNSKVPSSSSTLSASSSSSSTSCTPPPRRKTPEPVRFNPEPWAPRGRFTLPSHSRSLSSDFNSMLSSYSFLPSYQASSYDQNTFSLPTIPLHNGKISSYSLLSTHRYPPSYLPPHASPMGSRRYNLESRQSKDSQRSSRSCSRSRYETSPTHPPTSYNAVSSSSYSTPSVISSQQQYSSPHYRYTQEAHYKSRPYYTPEPVRRVYPRQNNTKP